MVIDDDEMQTDGDGWLGWWLLSMMIIMIEDIDD